MPETADVLTDINDHRHPTEGDDGTAVALASLHAMGSGTPAEFVTLYTADAVNREAVNEPPDTRGRGPAAMYATARWLRTAFSDLAWEVHDVVQDGDRVVVHATMSGRQSGPFVAYRPDGGVEVAFPPRGRTFAVTQTHWFRMSEGRVAEHWANRDDLSMGQQLGWNPPTPVYLVRMLLAARRARRGEFSRSGDQTAGQPL
jgi:predicted ester cyclase